jgi:hypothetical protein
MPYTPYYVPPEQIVNGLFTIHCNDAEFVLNRELDFLYGLRFIDLLKISRKLGVFARRRQTKFEMIREIERIIVFEQPVTVQLL